MAKVHLIYIDIATGYFPGVHHGLAWLTAALRSAGHTVTFEHLSSEKPPYAVAEMALGNNPDVVGFSVSTNQRKYLGRYSKAISEIGAVLQVVGGVHPTIDPMDVFGVEGIKGVCIGEGEQSSLNLLKNLDNRESIASVLGFWWRDNEGKLTKNPVAPLDPDLSKLPYPDYSIFDIEEINRASGGWMAMLLIRGCPYNCYYCLNHVLRSVYPNKKNYVRIPSVEYAIEVIKNNLSYDPTVKGINFADDLFLFDKGWFKEFAERYRREVSLPFTCNARVEYITDEICKELKEAGCVMVQMGVESGSEWLRKNLLNRQHGNDQIIRAFQIVKRFGIKTFAYNILGFPFETKEQMKKTLSLNKLIRPHMGATFYFFPYPSTRLYSICKQFDLINGSMEELSGYLEKPAIKPIHCKTKDCKKIYNKLKLYLLSQTASKNIRFGSRFISFWTYFIFRAYPAFFVRIFTKRSKFKSLLRRIVYGGL